MRKVDINDVYMKLRYGFEPGYVLVVRSDYLVRYLDIVGVDEDYKYDKTMGSSYTFTCSSSGEKVPSGRELNAGDKIIVKGLGPNRQEIVCKAIPRNPSGNNVANGLVFKIPAWRLQKFVKEDDLAKKFLSVRESQRTTESDQDQHELGLDHPPHNNSDLV